MIITKEQLLNGIRSLPKAAIITLTAEIDPDLKKTNNPYYGRIKKVITINCSLGMDYEASVNRQRERENKETDFIVEHHRWADFVENALVENRNTGEFALRVIEHKRISEQYYLDNEPIDKVVLQPFMKSRKPSTKQGTEKPIRYRNIYVNGKPNFRGIISIKYGDNYIVQAQQRS